MNEKQEKKIECLYPGDGRVRVLLGKQKKPADGEKVRWSRFVFPMQVDGKVLLFHTLTRKLFVIDCETYEYLAVSHGDGSTILSPTLIRQNRPHVKQLQTPSDDEIINQLYEDWFFVTENTNESQIYLDVKNILVVKEELPKGITHYVILPTTTCNARCFYCFEQGMVYRKMSKETVEDVIRFIVEHKPKDRKQIHIHWFGGEPMCAADNIDRICDGLNEAGIEYTAEMTSNGSLFDEESAKKAFVEWKVSEIQITLDGMADEYAKRKNYISLKDSFDTVIRNMHVLIDAGIKVKTRLNTDENNIDDIYRVAEYLRTEFNDEEKDRMRVYAHSLFNQEGEGLDACPVGSASDALEAKVQEINDNLIRIGLTGKDLSELFNLKSHFCMVTSPECNVLIDSSGRLFACDAMTEDMAYGDVKSGINVEAWAKVAKPCAVRNECKECVFLTQCTEFDRCPNRIKYDDCYRQGKRKLESDLRFMYSIYLDQKEQKEKDSVSD